MGTPPAAWLAEYTSVSATGLSATLVTSTNMEGSSAGAQRNFDQKVLLAALHARRGELDSAYLDAIIQPPPIIAQPSGHFIRLGP